MQRLVWQNSIGNEIDLTTNPYGITEWEGFANTSLNIQSQQVPFQDGGVFLDALIEQRELSVTLAMNDGGNLEARYRMRRELVHALNPKLGEGYLIYTNDFISKRIKCVPQIPLFETHNSNDSGTPKASLAWTACEPYWEDLEETIVTFGGFSGAEYSRTITNNGDVPAGLEIEFKCDSGEYEKPFINNITQAKRIQFNGMIDSKTPLIINTNVGNKTVTKKEINIDEFYENDIQNVIFNDYYNKYFGSRQIFDEQLDKWITNIYRSDDLSSWELVTTIEEYDVNFTVYKNILIVVINDDENPPAKVMISTDFENWFEREINYSIESEIEKIYCFETRQDSVTYYHIGIYTGSIYFGHFRFNNDNILFNSTFTLLGAIGGIAINTITNEVYSCGDGNSYKLQININSNTYSWQTLAENVVNIESYNKIKYIPERDMLVWFGNNYGMVDYSFDGIHWTRNNLETIRNMSDIIFEPELNKFIVFAGQQKLGVTEDFDVYDVYSTEGYSVGIVLQKKDGKYYTTAYRISPFGAGFLIIDVLLGKNVISEISSDSDLNLSLNVGDNFIQVRRDIITSITYRQKYIGV